MQHTVEALGAMDGFGWTALPAHVLAYNLSLISVAFRPLSSVMPAKLAHWRLPGDSRGMTWIVAH